MAVLHSHIDERIKRTARDIDRLLWLRDIELVTRSNYLIKGLIDAGDLSFWFGESGKGKSFLLTDIAAHIAAGRDFLGRKVRQTGVLLVALEGQRGAKRRLYAIREKFGDDLKLAIYEDSLDLSSDADEVGKLIKTMKCEFAGCGLLIIDTLSRLLGSGSDSDPKDMNRAFQQFARIQRETGVHVAVVHHPGHGDKDRLRGTSNQRPNADTLVRIDRPEGSDISTATVLKQKDGEEGQRISFTLRQVVLGHDEDGDDITTCTVEYVDASTKEAAMKSARLSDTEKMILSLVKEAGPSGIETDDLNERARSIAPQLRRQTLYNTRTALRDKGLIYQGVNGWSLRP